MSPCACHEQVPLRLAKGVNSVRFSCSSTNDCFTFSEHPGISHQSMSARHTGDEFRVSLHAPGPDHGRRRNARPGGTERGLRKNPLRATRPQLSHPRWTADDLRARRWRMARSPSSPIILPCPAKRVSAFSVVDPKIGSSTAKASRGGAESSRYGNCFF